MSFSTISPHLRLKKDSQEVAVTYQKDGREHTRIYELTLEADSLDNLGGTSTNDVARYVESFLLPKLAQNFDRFESAVRMDLEIDPSSESPRQFYYATTYTGNLVSAVDKIQDIFNGNIPAAPSSSLLPPRDRSWDPADIKAEPPQKIESPQVDLKGKKPSQALPKQPLVQTAPKNPQKSKKKQNKESSTSSTSSTSNSSSDSSSEESSSTTTTSDSSRKKKKKKAKKKESVSSDSGSSSSSESESSSKKKKKKK